MIKYKSIFIKNIYYMLSYAFTSLNRTDFEDVKKEDFDDIHNLFASILSRGISQQLKQGLYREYINRKEDLTVMRGKIDIPSTIKARILQKRFLACEYDELSENNILNQILKTTAMLLIYHSEVDTEHVDNLKKEMLFFSNVDILNPSTIRWTSIRFQRNNQAYRMIIGICQLIIEGMLLTTDQGDLKLASYLDEKSMSRLYEKFILYYYIKEFPGLKTSSSQIRWGLDDGISTMLPVMQSDIMISHKDTVLIIDAKLYVRTTQVQYDVHKVHSSNLYQIFTYVKNKDLELKDRPHKVSGMLLYARTEETIQPDNVYSLSGNKISIKTLDLNLEFKEIAAQLNSIVLDHFNI